MGDHIAGPSSTQLPPGWSAHISPTGRTYYHNADSGHSTYHPPHLPKPKREKPISKISIPNTSGWFKVTTNKDNAFYFHPETKTSEWLPPKEIVDAVRQMEEFEVREKERLKREQEEKEREERERVKREKRDRKRKLQEGVPITEFDTTKRAKADEEEEDEEDGDDVDDESIPSDEGERDKEQDKSGNQQDASDAKDDDDDDEEWQRQIAEQMAAEAEAEAEAANLAPPQQQSVQATTPTATASETSAPTASIEDQKQAFMQFLTSLNSTPKEVNPMAPWDLELPKFSNHPTYLALPSQSEREDAFNEWCKLRIREKRAAKASSATTPSAAAASSSSKAPTSSSAEERFRVLLKEEVRSTRTKWFDFRSAFSRDSRFTSFGRSDSDREKFFKSHLVELGERKRVAAEKAEREFLDLLSDKIPGNYSFRVSTAKSSAAGKGKEEEKKAVMDVWTEAKRSKGVVEDKRYDAVGSSTRRFELFCEWAKGERRSLPSAGPSRIHSDDQSQESKENSRKAEEKEQARRRALAEREEKVRRERERINRMNRSAFLAATHSESLLLFQQLLLDAVHSPHTSYNSALAQLSVDPRFAAARLSESEKEELFREHQKRLSEKEESKIGTVFAKYGAKLDVEMEDLIALTLQDTDLSHPPLSVYRENPDLLEKAYRNWDKKRKDKAERDFKEMLRESAFVEFWGRLRKEAQSSAPSEMKQEREEGEDEEEDDGDGTTLLDMARKIDLGEIESVLRNDARFRMWKHDPELRRRWIREHLEKLAAPGKSVHR